MTGTWNNFLMWSNKILMSSWFSGSEAAVCPAERGFSQTTGRTGHQTKKPTEKEFTSCLVILPYSFYL